MKIIFSILALFCLNIFAYAEGNWGIKTMHPGGNVGNNDFNNMYAYGDSVFIYHGETFEILPGNKYRQRYIIRYTLDSGATWAIMLDTVRTKKLFGVDIYDKDWDYMEMHFFPPSTVQLALWTTATIFTSRDWGKNWEVKQMPIIKVPNDTTGVSLLPLDTLRQIYKIGWRNSALRRKYYVTYDGWKTYEEKLSPDTTGSYFIRMLNDTDMFCEFSVYPYYSRDRGKTWNSSSLPIDFGLPNEPAPIRFFQYYAIPNSRTIFGCGGHNVYYKQSLCPNVAVWKSTDGGETWKIKLSTKDTSMYGGQDIKVNRDGLGMVIGSWNLADNGKGLITPIYMTSDMGETWNYTPFADTIKSFGRTYNCAVGGSVNNCWAFVTPYLYKFDPKGKVKVEDEYINKALLSAAIKLWPNPVKSGASMQIDLSVLDNENVEIKIYTPEGKLIDSHSCGIDKQITYVPKAPAGSYFMEIITFKNKIIKNFVIE